ncbi:MAG: (d)CMP kinase [Burkholderiales bacterium]|jgi:3-phosphoshikimate 1-carboxyvinyltransferase|nr:(d)CMP kinase [Burkholderiales bacterium]
MAASRSQSLAPVIAIDGPSASGKGTVAQGVAAALGFHYLDSGALYRLVALAAMRAGTPLDAERAVAALAESLPASFRNGETLLGGVVVTDDLRTEACSAAASKVAAFPAVRTALLARQRAFRQPPGLVADGRDMGSVVFPDAGLKVFLTAGAEVRAERRYKQLIDKGIPANIDALLLDLRERDARDASRPVAPLVRCPDARLLDTTGITVAEAVATVVAWYREAA